MTALPQDSVSAAQDAAGQKLLSAVVPVYNVLPYLDRCVESLLAQNYRNIEILLVDDGSADGSGVRCDEWAARDTRIRVIHQENGGLSVARNAGMDAANGHWLTFVDSDDWVAAEMLEKLIGLCIQYGAQIGACAFNYVFPDREQPAGDTGAVTVLTRDEALSRLFAQHEARFEACARVYLREALGDARFVPGQIYEDIHFTRLTFLNMERYVYIDRPYYQYLQKRPGSTNTRFPREKLAVVEECDAFSAQLSEEGLTDAAHGMEAFTLEHLIRMFYNAKACHADAELIRQILGYYRTRFFRACRAGNSYVKKARGCLFAVSPGLYAKISAVLHRSDRSETQAE